MTTPIPRLALLASLASASLLACSPGASPPGQPGSRTQALSAPAVGTAGDFAILAATAVTCTDATILGNVGVSPGTAITQTSCPVTGTVNAGDGAAAQAQADFLVAYAALALLPCDQVLTTLDGQALAPGVYCFDAAATSTGGVLALDGPATGTWIFKVGTLGTGALTTTGFSVVTPSGTPPPCGSVFWWVAEAATVTDSQFVGNILAGAAITLTRGTFSGDAYSQAAVTITGAAVTGCALDGGGGGPGSCKGSGDDDDDGDDDGDDDRDDDGCQCRGADGEDDDRSSGRDSGSSGSRCGGHDDDDGDGDGDDDDDDDDGHHQGGHGRGEGGGGSSRGGGR